MGELRVEPEALRLFAGDLGDGLGDAGACIPYVLKHCVLDFPQDGFMALLLRTHERFLNDIHRDMGTLQGLLDQCRSGVSTAAGYYETTEAGAAAALDATFPAVRR